MNFIDAYMICCKYTDVFASTQGLYKPLSALYACGVSSKKEIEDAMILRFSHSILWMCFDRDEFERMRVLLSCLNTFVSDDLAQKHNKHSEVIQRTSQSLSYKLFHKREVAEAKQFLLQNTNLNIYDDSRLCNTLIHIENYMKHVIYPKMNALWRLKSKLSKTEHYQQFMNNIADFSDEVYRFANISTTSYDYYTFVSFDMMRDWIDDANLGRYYNKYRDYILVASDD